MELPNVFSRGPERGDGGRDPVVKSVRDKLWSAWEHDRDNRIDAASDLNFLAGNQWDDAVRRQRADAGRPMLTVNRLPQFVRQVTNDIRQADIAIKVVPSDGAAERAEMVPQSIGRSASDAARPRAEA